MDATKCFTRTLVASESYPLRQDTDTTILSFSNVDDPSHITLSLGPCMLVEYTLDISGGVQLTTRVGAETSNIDSDGKSRA